MELVHVSRVHRWYAQKVINNNKGRITTYFARRDYNISPEWSLGGSSLSQFTLGRVYSLSIDVTALRHTGQYLQSSDFFVLRIRETVPIFAEQ